MEVDDCGNETIVRDVEILQWTSVTPEDIENMEIIVLDQNPQVTNSESCQQGDNHNDDKLESPASIENHQNQLNNGNCIEISQIEPENEVIRENLGIDNSMLEPNRSEKLLDIVVQEQNDKQEEKLTRKKKRQPEKWKRNIRKQKRQAGEEYISTKGKTVKQKEVIQKTCRSENCPFACGRKLNYAERSDIHKAFWKLTDNEKSHFISKHVVRDFAKRKRTDKEQSHKQFSYQYFFEVNAVRIRVCQEFFLNTLDISKQRIYYFFKKMQQTPTNIPRRSLKGKHKKKYVSDESLMRVRNHIESFPVVDSHYCRATSKKKYLERDLNLRRMYNLYIESTTENPVSYKKYSEIFNYEYNISFFKPKKDLCDRCQEFEVLKEPTEQQSCEYQAHVQRKNMAKVERDRDRALTKQANNKLCILCYDLQNVFALPKTNVSHYYYRSKLNTYNLTGHCSSNNTVYNAIWHEYICGRGANHLASAVIKILKKLVRDNPEVERLILWSDSCVPQNRNSILSFAIQTFLNSNDCGELKVIEHKYSEPGHSSIQEIDAVHSTIEAYVRNLEIWSPVSLIRILTNMPTNFKMQFKVLQMQPQDFLNYQNSASKLAYNQIPYSQIKKLTYSKKLNEVYVLKYACSFEGSENSQILLPKCKKAKLTSKNIFNAVPSVLETNTGITKEKKEALKAMLPQMPDHAKEFYLPIINTNKVKQSKITNNVDEKRTEVCGVSNTKSTSMVENQSKNCNNTSKRKPQKAAARSDGVQTRKKGTKVISATVSSSKKTGKDKIQK